MHRRSWGLHAANEAQLLEARPEVQEGCRLELTTRGQDTDDKKPAADLRQAEVDRVHNVGLSIVAFCSQLAQDMVQALTVLIVLVQVRVLKHESLRHHLLYDADHALKSAGCLAGAAAVQDHL